MPEIGSELRSRLRVVCGGANVVTDKHELAVYGAGVIRGAGSASPTGGAPLAVALPGNMTEVASCVAACLAAGVPWRPRGANTWLPEGGSGAGSRFSSGFGPGSGSGSGSGVTIALTRMRRVLAADPGEGSLRAEAGTPGRRLIRSLPGLATLAPSESVATLGGLLATPHAGPRTLGGHRLRVLAVTLVLPDGELAELRAGASGYDLLGRFLGSAGTFGVLVDATVAVGGRL